MKIAILAAAAACLPLACTAQPKMEPVSYTLTLDKIENQADAEKAYRTLQRAARAICRDFGAKSGKYQNSYHDCRVEALKKAVADLNNPLVSAIHEVKK